MHTREGTDSRTLSRWAGEASPKKVAWEILWLASAEASFATGAFLVVIGGK